MKKKPSKSGHKGSLMQALEKSSQDQQQDRAMMPARQMPPPASVRQAVKSKGKY